MAGIVMHGQSWAFKDVTGQRFGRLVAVELSGRTKDGKYLWHCVCDCGGEATVRGTHLRRNQTQSCGCLHDETTAERNRRSRTHGHTAGVTKGGKPTPEYKAWRCMIGRCYEPNHASFARYGEAGIEVCDRWRHSFEAFLADMGPKPSPRHSLDRIKNSLGYSPENCRWATATEQANNRCSNIVITWRERALSIAEWSRETGLSEYTISKRLRKGWTLDDILTLPIHPGKPYRLRA